MSNCSCGGRSEPPAGPKVLRECSQAMQIPLDTGPIPKKFCGEAAQCVAIQFCAPFGRMHLNLVAELNLDDRLIPSQFEIPPYRSRYAYPKDANDRRSRDSGCEEIARNAGCRRQDAGGTRESSNAMLYIGPAASPGTGASYFCSSLSKAESNARRLGSKSALRTNSQASLAPWSRSMPQSSHSTERGPS